jgi:hypothetical protein
MTVGSVITGLIAVALGWLIEARVRRWQERKLREVSVVEGIEGRASHYG